MNAERELRLWNVLWNLGLVAWLVGIPALLGFLSGSRLEDYSAVHAPWRVVLAAVGGGVGGVLAWRALSTRARVKRR